MRLRKTPLAVLVALAAVSTVAAFHFHGCESLNYVAHGTFSASGDCLLFTPEPSLEIPDPEPFGIVDNGSWRAGMTGTVYAQTADGPVCGANQALQICDWDADFSRNVVGTLVIINFIECPGYYIRQGGAGNVTDYFIVNNEDFPELFVPENVGKRIRAEVLVDTGVTNCIGKAVSTLIDYDFAPNQ